MFFKINVFFGKNARKVFDNKNLFCYNIIALCEVRV